MNDFKFNSRLTENFSLFSGALVGLSIPISTFAENLGALFLLCVAFLPQVRERIVLSLRHPFAIACIALYGAFLFGVLYTSAPEYSTRMLVKIRPFLLAPLFLAACTILSVRRAIIYGFLAGTALSLVLSILSWLLNIPILNSYNGNWPIFRSHSYHNIFISWLILTAISLILSVKLQGGAIIGAILVIALGIFDIFFLVQGRTGHILLIISLLLLLLMWNWRKGAIIGLFLSCTALPLIWFSSDIVRTRYTQAESEIQVFSSGKAEETSLGFRLTWYKTALPIILKAPFFGHGTGSFETEFRRETAMPLDRTIPVPALVSPSNPHSDYIWIAIELGIVGVALLIGVFAMAVRSASNLPLAQRWMTTVVVVSIGIGTLMNSLVTDNVSGTGFIVLLCALLGGPLISPSLLVSDKPHHS
jgi:O-antigen ligase